MTMKKYVKPIQMTPTLSGQDAQIIVRQALTAPSKQAIDENERRLEESKKAFKEWVDIWRISSLKRF